MRHCRGWHGRVHLRRFFSADGQGRGISPSRWISDCLRQGEFRRLNLARETDVYDVEDNQLHGVALLESMDTIPLSVSDALGAPAVHLGVVHIDAFFVFSPGQFVRANSIFSVARP